MAAPDSTPHNVTVTGVQLIPWDPESDEHVERLIQQRIACGWNSEAVETRWRNLQRIGHKCMYWVVSFLPDCPWPYLTLLFQVLADGDPQRSSLEEQHVAAYPAEGSAISDTASSLGGKMRSTRPVTRPFIPVGHISLDSSAADQPGVTYDEEDALRIANLYISRVLQGTGLGRLTMDALEQLASSEPLCARTLVLATNADEYPGRVEKLKAMGRDPPTVSLCYNSPF